MRNVAGGGDRLDIRLRAGPRPLGREGEAARARRALRAVGVEARHRRGSGQRQRGVDRAVLPDRIGVAGDGVVAVAARVRVVADEPSLRPLAAVPEPHLFGGRCRPGRPARAYCA